MCAMIGMQEREQRTTMHGTEQWMKMQKTPFLNCSHNHLPLVPTGAHVSLTPDVLVHTTGSLTQLTSTQGVSVL